MKRLTNQEKTKLGILINYYRNLFFRSKSKNAQDFKQINFCKNICSQAQLSRLENGEPLKKHEIYYAFLIKLNLSCEKVSSKDLAIFETYLENIFISQNNDNLLINYNEYVLIINKYQNIFKNNIIYTHYNYILELVLMVLNNDIEEASYLIDDIKNTLDILPPKILVLALHYLGKYYHLIQDYNNSTKYYLLSIEHMHKNSINNPIIYLDITSSYIKKYQYIYAIDYINKALNYFIDSENYTTIAKTYKYYGIIYLYNKYYDEGINFFMESLQYCKKSNIHNIEKTINNLIVVALYLKDEHQEALNILMKSVDTDEGKLLYNIINQVENEDIKYNNKYYQSVAKFYNSTTNKELQYEKDIKPIINNLPDEIRLVIIHDVLKYYYSVNKYKKVLEIIEDFII